VRLLDTRTTHQTLGANSTLPLNVETAADGVPSTATAVALNVTTAATGGGVVTSPGYVSVYPTGGTRPLVSNLNFTMGETVPNSVIVPVNSAGSVTFYNHTGNTDLVVDIQGYFAPESGGSTAGAYVPLTPARITDTRTSSGYPNAGKTLAAGGTLNVQVTGAGGVPAGATGAILNVTVTNTTDSGYLEAYPQGATQPTASNLNWTTGETVANRVLVSLSSTGMITLYNHTGNSDVVVDVNGYFTNGTATLPSNASLYSPITPTRLLDTRVSGGTLSAGGIDTQQIAGQGGIPSTATAGVLNVTATNTTAASFFTVYPAGGAQPTASDVNWSAGQIVPNLTVATLSSTGAVDVYNHAGSADLVIDAFGYFSYFTTPVVVAKATNTSIVETTGTSSVSAVVTSTALTYPDPVQFTESGAACGTFTGGVTSISGGSVTASGGTTPSTVTYTAGSSVGTCVITATEASGLNQGSITITQTAPIDAVSITSGGATVVTAGSTTPFAITAHVQTAGGTAVAGDTVAFTESGTPTGACGTLTPVSATTNASGNAVTLYTPTTTSGFCQVTATEANTGQKVVTTVTTEQTAPPSGIGVVVNSTPTIVNANGTTTSAITVTVKNSGTAVSGDPVSLTSTGTPALACGTLASGFLTTGVLGTATTTYTSSITSGVCQITATEANDDVSSPAGNDSTLTTGLTTGAGSTTSLAVTALAAAIPSGSTVDVMFGTHTQQFVTTAAVAAAATAIPVVASTGNYNYPITTTQVVTDGSSVIEQPTPPTAADLIIASPTTYSSVAGSGSIQAVTVTVTAPVTGTPVSGDPVTYATSGTCGGITPTSPLTTGSNGVANFAYTTGALGVCIVSLTDSSGGLATFTATAHS
jgi:hypothetical protein